MTDQTVIKKPAPAPLAFTMVRTDSGEVSLPCEPINEWLAITPVVGMDVDGKTWLIGTFMVTHRPTGTALLFSSGCIYCCRQSAEVFARFDWSSTADEGGVEAMVAAFDDEQRRVFSLAMNVWCDTEYCAGDDEDEETP